LISKIISISEINHQKARASFEKEALWKN